MTKKKIKYYLYRVNNNKRTVVKSFLATDDSHAYNVLLNYKKNHKKDEYYYASHSEYVIDPYINSSKDILINIYQVIWSFLPKLINKFILFFKYSKNLFNCETANDRFLNILEFNVLELFKSDAPYRFLFKSRKILCKKKKTTPLFFLNLKFSDNEIQLANELWQAELSKLLMYIKLYKYYSLSTNLTKDEYKYIESKLEHEIPTIPGKYNQLDYDKLNSLANLYWKRILSWLSEFGQDIYCNNTYARRQ